MRHCLNRNKVEEIIKGQYLQNIISDVIFNKNPQLSTQQKIKESTEKLSKRTFFQELYFSLLLSDFYFGQNIHTKICFEMKSGFDPALLESRDLSLEGLNEWVESRSPVDISILNSSKEFKFQIKTYPEKYNKSLATEDFTTYIRETCKGYGDMSDVILVLIPQVKNPGDTLITNLEHLKDNLKKLQISFEEIILLLNVKGIDHLFHAYKKE